MYVTDKLPKLITGTPDGLEAIPEISSPQRLPTGDTLRRREKLKHMKSESTKLRDFSGQNIYVGMDVHHKSWKVHIYSGEFELKLLSQEPESSPYMFLLLSFLYPFFCKEQPSKLQPLIQI